MKLEKITIAIMLVMVSFGWAYNYHGSAIARINDNNWKGWIVTIDTNLVLHTPYNGISWINQSFLTSRYFFDVFCLDTQRVWIGTDQGFIYYSNNGGANWTIQVMGLAKHTARIFFIDDSCGWAACGGAIWGRTTDGGQYWDQLFLPYPPFHIDTVDLYDISFVNPQKGWFCAGRYPELVNDTLHFKRGQGYIAVSNDGGINWQLQRKDTIFDFFGIKFKDSLNGIVVGGDDSTKVGVVMKTENGGNIWSIVSIPSQAKYLRALEWVGNHLWAVGRNGTIIHSANNGTTWSMQQSYVDTTLFDVDFCDTLHGLIAGNGYVLYTNDGGNNWHIANVGISENSKFKVQNSCFTLKAFPNPFWSQVEINKPIDDNVYIYNITGNLVRTYKTRTTRILWNGRDNSGRFVPSGIYFALSKSSAVPKSQQKSIPLIYQRQK